MEEKIYERQVVKQSVSYRIVDEKEIARHFTKNELLELYKFDSTIKQKVDVFEPKVRIIFPYLNYSSFLKFI